MNYYQEFKITRKEIDEIQDPFMHSIAVDAFNLNVWDMARICYEVYQLDQEQKKKNLNKIDAYRKLQNQDTK